MFKYIDNTIETDRLILRRFVMEDAPVVSEICSSEKVYRGTLSLPHPYTQECAENWISAHDKNFEEDRFNDFAITDKADGTLYGCVGIGINMRDHNGEIGYWIDSNQEGNGYATEAAEALIRYAFEIKKLHRVTARHFASNPASGRVMQKCKMTYEGTLKDYIYKIDHYEDVVYYGIINSRD